MPATKMIRRIKIKQMENKSREPKMSLPTAITPRSQSTIEPPTSAVPTPPPLEQMTQISSLHVLIGDEVEQRQEIFIQQMYPFLEKERAEPSQLWFFTNPRRALIYQEFFPEAHYRLDDFKQCVDQLGYDPEEWDRLLTDGQHLVVIDHPEVEFGIMNSWSYGCLSYLHHAHTTVLMDHRINLKKCPCHSTPNIWLIQPVLDFPQQFKNTYPMKLDIFFSDPLEEWWEGGQIVIFNFYADKANHYYVLKWDPQLELETITRLQQQRLEMELRQQQIAPDELTFWEENEKRFPSVGSRNELFLSSELYRSMKIDSYLPPVSESDLL